MIKKLNWACCYACSSDNIVVETTEARPEWVQDGDTLTCQSCGEKGYASCDGEGGATDRWNCEEDEEFCLP